MRKIYKHVSIIQKSFTRLLLLDVRQKEQLNHRQKYINGACAKMCQSDTHLSGDTDSDKCQSAKKCYLLRIRVHCESKKNWATFIFTVTLSNVGRF